MQDAELLNAIKAGMKGELDSVSIYEGAAATSEGEVKKFFLERAETEKRHFNYLLEYYKTKTINLNFERDARAELGEGWRSAIISETFVKQIAASRQLTAAVAASLRLEAEAARLYAEWAARAKSQELKGLLETLAAWEKRHYDDLLSIQEELERHYFDINSFTPF